MLKLLHCADVHLDAPSVLLAHGQTEIRQTETRATFSSLILYIRKSGIRLALIAGDLFDNAHVTRETLAYLQKEFAAAPDCHFVISPGSHDFYTPECAYATTPFSQNVHIFREPALSSFRFDDLGVTVWGFAHTKPQQRELTPLAQLPPAEQSHIRLLCCHADLSGEDKNCPQITKEQLAHGGFAYAALGHDHEAGAVRRIGNTCFAYAGCLEGHDFSDTGYKGALCAELSRKADGTPSFSARRLRFSRRHYETAVIDVTGCESTEDIRARITAAAEPFKPDSDTALRLTATGTLSPTLTLTRETVEAMLPPLFFFEFCDKTDADQSPAWLENDPTLRGAFYRELKPLLESGDGNKRETAYLALRLGLQALL